MKPGSAFFPPRALIVTLGPPPYNRQFDSVEFIGVSFCGERAVLAGPIFSRELLTSPRQIQFFLLRAGYVAALFVLTYTAGQATFGWQQVSHVGDLARFGTLLFQLFSAVQLLLVLFFAPLFAASRVAQEKDRQTLVLLLMTDLRDRELVLGKLLASLLSSAALLTASIPVFTLVYLLGGVSLAQIGWSVALCAATGFAAGSWGSLVAFWREKTFQTLAISALGIVLFIGVVEALQALLAGTAVGPWLLLLDPFRGLLLVLDPLAALPAVRVEVVPAWPYVLSMLLVGAVLNVVAILRLRLWNPTRSVYETAKVLAEVEKANAVSRAPDRAIWSNPILWREICTRAYGRRMIFVKLAYFALFLFAGVYIWQAHRSGAGQVLGLIAPHGFAFVAMGFISLLLVNAQTVTALTTERDAKTLELLLVTDVSAREFIFGKLLGALYNAKEVVLLPLLALCGYAWTGLISWENFVYVGCGFLLLAAFAATLGMHSGLGFDNSRSAIGNSLGTMFFLFLGIFVCMLLIVEARTSFMLQLPSFLVFILGGSLGLWASLTHKNPSPALTLSALLLPFFTFYAITGFLLNDTLGIWVVISATYGFTVLAMLVPAISEFDVALGRSTMDQG